MSKHVILRHASPPDFDAPRAGNRMLQRWCQCPVCKLWYAAPEREIEKGKRLFCSIQCFGDHAKETGRFAGENNPRWLGGVSKDNMRYRNRQKERHPVEEDARRQVHNAIRRGDLVPEPCERCGARPTQGHHDDYSKPLAVRWLCRPCHDAHHAEVRDDRS